MLIKRQPPRELAEAPPDEPPVSSPAAKPPWRRRRMPHIPLPVAIGAALVLLILAILGIPAAGTLLTLKAGGDDLRAGASQLEGKGIGITTRDTASADAYFRKSENEFIKAESGLHNDAAFRLISLVRSGKRQVDASVVLARSAVHVARAGHLGVNIANQLIAENVIGPGTHGTVGDMALSMLDAVTPRLDPIISELSAAQAERSRLPAGWLLPPIHSAVSVYDSRFGGVVSALKELPAIEPGLRALLGANGPQLYLVLQQDSAEIRPTGGFIGSVGFFGFNHGKMRPYESHPVESLDINSKGRPVLGKAGDPTYVAPPPPFQLLINSDSWELRDANWSPDFPTSAKLAQAFFTRENHQHLKASGVIAIDPTLAADLLSVTGPIYLPETKQTLTADNFFQDTMVAVHSGVGKSILSYAAKAIMDRLAHVGPSSLLHVVSVIQRGCETRSVQAYFDDPAAEGMVERFHCAGRIAPLTSDGVYVVDTNMGGAKDDYWVTRQFNLSLQVHPDGSVEHTLQLHYDGSQLVPNGDLTLPYRDWLRVYLPAGSHVVHVEGIGGHGLGPRTVRDLGRTVVQGWVEFGYQGSADVMLIYDVPASLLPDGRHHVDLYWQKQAGRVKDPIGVSIELPPGWSMAESRLDGATVRGSTIQSDLALDRQFSFTYQSP